LPFQIRHELRKQVKGKLPIIHQKDEEYSWVWKRIEGPEEDIRIHQLLKSLATTDYHQYFIAPNSVRHYHIDPRIKYLKINSRDKEIIPDKDYTYILGEWVVESDHSRRELLSKPPKWNVRFSYLFRIKPFYGEKKLVRILLLVDGEEKELWFKENDFFSF